MKHFAVVLGALAALSGAARADTITDWNQTTMAVMKAANVGGNPASRTLAMVHVAMSDAVNAVQAAIHAISQTFPRRRAPPPRSPRPPQRARSSSNFIRTRRP